MIWLVVALLLGFLVFFAVGGLLGLLLGVLVFLLVAGAGHTVSL